MMATERTYVVPGEILDRALLPLSSLKLGPGLRHLPPNSLTPIVPGQFISDEKKSAIWIENDPGRVGSCIQIKIDSS